MTAAAHAPTLYLDHEWRPLRVESWTRAISDFCLGKVEVIEYSKDRTIRGVSREYPLPSVVRVLKKFKREKIRIKFSRLNIYARDKFTCQYCNVRFDTEELTFDHVVPRSRGGRTSWENIVTACGLCNSEKSDRTPDESNMRPLTMPKKPTFLPTIQVKMKRREIPHEWRAYWTGPLDS
jgi:5-methylcytosine-specific restriction endonuclease McrA